MPPAPPQGSFIRFIYTTPGEPVEIDDAVGHGDVHFLVDGMGSVQITVDGLFRDLDFPPDFNYTVNKIWGLEVGQETEIDVEPYLDADGYPAVDYSIRAVRMAHA